MQNKFWKWSKNETTGERTLRLDGVISDFKWFDEEDEDGLTTPKEFRDELNSATGNIILEIYSPGGNYFAAAEIYQILKEYSGGKITAKINSYAASAATIIMCACDSVEVSPLAMLCIHNPFLGWVAGEEKDMIQAANYLAELKENVINVYEMKTGLSRKQIAELMDAETYMNAKKAVELHFADKIMVDDVQNENEIDLEPAMYSPKQNVTSMLKRLEKIKVEKKPVQSANQTLTVKLEIPDLKFAMNTTEAMDLQKKFQNNQTAAIQLQKRLNLVTH